MNCLVDVAVNTKRTFTPLAVALAALVSIATSQAQPVTPVLMVDGNSTARVDVGSDLGMYSWTFNGIENLRKQWFWYRIGDTVAAPINTIGPATWFNLGPNALNVTYGNPNFSVMIDYLLVGGSGVGGPDITENISIHNTSQQSLVFHFFQYSDFNLASSPGGDSVEVANTYDFARQQKGNLILAETITSPAANSAEAGLAGALEAKLAGITQLDGTTLTAGPDDVAWAFQWDFVIAPGEIQNVFKDKHLALITIPEPASLLLVAMGFGLLLRRIRG